VAKHAVGEAQSRSSARVGWSRVTIGDQAVPSQVADVTVPGVGQPSMPGSVATSRHDVAEAHDSCGVSGIIPSGRGTGADHAVPSHQADDEPSTCRHPPPGAQSRAPVPTEAPASGAGGRTVSSPPR
jgi:hypothetical protein